MSDSIQRAMKADYLKVLSENKKMRQQIANLEKEIAHLTFIPTVSQDQLYETILISNF